MDKDTFFTNITVNVEAVSSRLSTAESKEEDECSHMQVIEAAQRDLDGVRTAVAELQSYLETLTQQPSEPPPPEPEPEAASAEDTPAEADATDTKGETPLSPMSPPSGTDSPSTLHRITSTTNLKTLISEWTNLPEGDKMKKLKHMYVVRDRQNQQLKKELEEKDNEILKMRADIEEVSLLKEMLKSQRLENRHKAATVQGYKKKLGMNKT
eukprot:GFYU01042750.1.p1 GENE.GFYU01042750.1~~GFYU01042750.1.p1  ORF type:complete len:223 (-),score=55.94 GFYU01042750.1:148-780(-)